MKYLPLVWRNLVRRKTRTTFTVLSIMVAFLLFGILAALNMAFNMGVELAGNDRLVITHKVSIIQLLPESYEARLETTPGVVDVLHQTYFGGILPEAEQLLHAVPGPSGQAAEALPRVRSAGGSEAGLAHRSHVRDCRPADGGPLRLKVGDRIPSRRRSGARGTAAATGNSTSAASTTATRKASTRRPSSSTDEYFDEARQFAHGEVGWYVIRINDPSAAPAVAERIDAQFANSFAETKTTTEKAFVQAFAKQVGDIGAIIRGIVTAVFFTILLVAANTMGQSVRERTSELAVLKTLGYSDGLVLALVLVESCAIAVVGGGIGLGLAWLITQGGDPTNGMLPAFFLPTADLVRGALFAAALGVVAGIMPAVPGHAPAHRGCAEEA